MSDCRVNISLVDPTVLVSSTENLLVKWGVGFTIDLPESLSPSSLALGFLSFLDSLPRIHRRCYSLSYEALDVSFS